MLISDLAVNPFGLANKIEAQTAPQTTIIRMKGPKIGRRGLDLQVVSMGTSPKHGRTLAEDEIHQNSDIRPKGNTGGHSGRRRSAIKGLKAAIPGPHR